MCRIWCFYDKMNNWVPAVISRDKRQTT